MILPKLVIADQSQPCPPLRLLGGGRAEQLPVTLDRFIGWYSGHFDLLAGFERLTDGRQASRVKVPLPSILLAVVVGFWVGLNSVHSVEDRLKHNGGLRALLGRLTDYYKPFCDDTMRDATAKLEPAELRTLVHDQCRRGTKQWGARHYADSVLTRRLRPLEEHYLAAKLVVAIDGHELFKSTERCCADCRVRTKTVERGGKKVRVSEYYHSIVVAYWAGTRPGLVLDFEPVKPGKGELSTAYTLLARLGQVYGKAIGIVLADALYDCEPWRRLAARHRYRVIHSHRDTRRDPGRSAKRALDQRDRERKKPDYKYKDPITGDSYAIWEQSPEPRRRYIEAIRTSKNGAVHKATLITDLRKDAASAVAVVLLYEGRWSVENSAFHELQGRWSFGHAFVHHNRPKAVWAFVTLTILAFNAMQMYVYRHLHRQPGAIIRPLKAYRDDLRETMILCAGNRRAMASVSAAARGP